MLLQCSPVVHLQGTTLMVLHTLDPFCMTAMIPFATIVLHVQESPHIGNLVGLDPVSVQDGSAVLGETPFSSLQDSLLLQWHYCSSTPPSPMLHDTPSTAKFELSSPV